MTEASRVYVESFEQKEQDRVKWLPAIATQLCYANAASLINRFHETRISVLHSADNARQPGEVSDISASL
jgi:hypothetical protein